MNNLFEDSISEHLLSNGLYTIKLVDAKIVEKRRADIKERIFKFDFIEEKSGKSVSRWMRATMDPRGKARHFIYQLCGKDFEKCEALKSVEECVNMVQQLVGKQYKAVISVAMNNRFNNIDMIMATEE